MISAFNCLKHLVELRRAQYLSREKLQERQNSRLRAIVRHAYSNVPYYHDLFKKLELNPDDIKTTDDLKKLPILTRQDVIQNYPSRICATGTDMSRCITGRSSGTTGEYVETLQDKKSAEYSTALVKYAFLECGMKMTDKFLEIGFPKKLPHFWFQKFGLFSKKMISLYDVPAKNVELIREFKADILYAYPSIMLGLAGALEEKNETLSLKKIFPRSERVTPSFRKRIASTLQGEIFDSYGACEFYRLAFECEQHEGMHMITDAAVIECLRNGESVVDEVGELIITGLYNNAMPLIRYRIGDVGVLAGEEYHCNCGRNWPILKSIEGRLGDCIYLKDKVVTPLVTEECLEFYANAKKFKLIQEKEDKFTVKILPNEKFTQKSCAFFCERMKDILGDVEIDVKIVDDLPLEKSGKFRSFESKVPARF